MTRPVVHAGNPCSLTGLKQNAKQRWAAIPPRRSETIPASHRKLNTSCFYLLILLTNANICSLKSMLTHNRRHKITLVLAALTQNQQGQTFKARLHSRNFYTQACEIVISVSQIYRLLFSKHSAVISQLWDVLCSYKSCLFFSD